MKKAISLVLASVMMMGALALGTFSVSADTVDATGKLTLFSSPFEFPGELNPNDAKDNFAAIYTCSDAEIRGLISGALGNVGTDYTIDGKGYAVVTLNGKDYKIKHYVNNEVSDQNGTVTTAYYRFALQELGAVLVTGEEYTIKVTIYDENNNAVVVSGEDTVKSTITSSNASTQTPGGEGTQKPDDNGTQKPDTQQPDTGKKPGDQENPPATGSASVVIAAVAAVSLAGVAVAVAARSRKKDRDD